MRVKFWGVRGSYPVPGAATNRYGGNTACVEICPPDGTPLIIDAGTGLRRLGQQLMRGPLGQGQGVAHLLISHTHWDHIQGLPFFAPLYVTGNTLKIYGPKRGVELETLFCSQSDAPYFTVRMSDVAAAISYEELKPGQVVQLGELQVRCASLNHPSRALGYRVSGPSGAVAYISDTAPFDQILFRETFIGQRPANGPSGSEEEQLRAMRREVVDLCRGCDLVIFDTMFRPAEYRARPHWGHSTPDHALQILQEADVPTLVLFHYAPDHTDDDLDQILAEVRAGTSRQVLAAAEGLELSTARPASERRPPVRAAAPRATAEPEQGDL